MGVEPLHWLSAVHAKQLPDASHHGCEAFLVLHCVLVAHAMHERVDESQMGVMPVHWESAVHSFVRSKLAAVGALGVDAATAYRPEIELAVALTLPIPDAFVVAVMHPTAAGTQAEPPLSVAVAPLVGAWNVATAPCTVTPGSELPDASATTTTNRLANAAPVGVVCGFPLTMKTAAGPVETFCRWKVAGVPTPETEAVTVNAPTVELAVAVTLDRPEESVVALTLAPLEGPFDTVHDAPEAGTAV